MDVISSRINACLLLIKVLLQSKMTYRCEYKLYCSNSGEYCVYIFCYIVHSEAGYLRPKSYEV
jgi:hypothetical protein